MKEEIKITQELARRKAADLVMAIPLDVPHEVIIQPIKKNRSLEQNALMWDWLTIIGDDIGYSKTELHEEYKGKLLVPLMLKYPKRYRAFCELVAAIQDLREEGNEKAADDIAKKALVLVSTTKLSVTHMTEYLNDIEKHAISLGVRLPAMEDIADNY